MKKTKHFVWSNFFEPPGKKKWTMEIGLFHLCKKNQCWKLKVTIVQERKKYKITTMKRKPKNWTGNDVTIIHLWYVSNSQKYYFNLQQQAKSEVIFISNIKVLKSHAKLNIAQKKKIFSVL